MIRPTYSQCENTTPCGYLIAHYPMSLELFSPEVGIRLVTATYTAGLELYVLIVLVDTEHLGQK